MISGSELWTGDHEVISELVGDGVGGADEEEETRDVVASRWGLEDVAVLAVDYEGLHGVLSSYGGVGGGEGEVDVPLARHIFSDFLFP